MEHIIEGANGSRGSLRFVDYGASRSVKMFKLTVSNGRGDTIELTITKDELKRLAKAC